MKRRLFIGATLAGIAGLGELSRRSDKEQEAAKGQKAAEAAKQAQAEKAEKNQSVLDPIYSVDKFIVEDDKDPVTGFTRPKISKDKSVKIASELTVSNPADADDNKIIILSNSANQTIKPKGGYNKIMLMPPLDFGKKVVDGTGGTLPSYNELFMDARILAHYNGTTVMRDGDDVIVKFMKAGQAPEDKTPTLVLKGQCAKGSKDIIRKFGIIKPDGKITHFEFVNEEALTRSLPWETAFNEMGKKAREALDTATPELAGAPDKKVGTLEELIEEYRAQSEALLKQIAAAKEKNEAPDTSKLSTPEKDLLALNERMKKAFQAQIEKDEGFLKKVTGIAFQKMAGDVKRQAAEAAASKVPPRP